jgi:hypothetical protein
MSRNSVKWIVEICGMQIQISDAPEYVGLGNGNVASLLKKNEWIIWWYCLDDSHQSLPPLLFRFTSFVYRF